MGLILFNRNTQMLCLDPQLLAKALACFVMPPLHAEMVYGKEAPSYREYTILPDQIVEKKLLGMKIATKENVSEVMKCLEQFDFCYKLDTNEEKMYNCTGYIFPFMRKEALLPLETLSQRIKVLTLGMLFKRSDYAIGSNFFFRLQVIAR